MRRLLTIAALPLLLAASTSAPARILVGPNVRVSFDAPTAHTEPFVAINPLDDKDMVATGAFYRMNDGMLNSGAYVSTDGGNTWRSGVIPFAYHTGSVDNMVDFGTSGTAYLTFMPAPSGDLKKSGPGLFVFRSTDGGKTWQPPFKFCGPDCDHEHFLVDRQSPHFRGAVYIDINGGRKKLHGIYLFRSTDDAKTFQDRLVVEEGKRDMVNLNSVVFTDGMLFVPYSEFNVMNTTAPNKEGIYFKTSSDGGKSFSAEKQVGTQVIPSLPIVRGNRHALRFDETALAEFTTDLSNGPYRNRLYAAWADVRFGRPRILFRSSNDRGRTWSPLRKLDPDVPAWSSQYQPMLAVNNRGVLGVTWFDTRASQKQDRYEEYFTASLDGGAHFLRPVSVSSVPSFPRSPGNFTLGLEDNGPTFNQTMLDFWSAFGHWPQSGDYMGLQTDSSGAFHPLWIDSRTPSGQLETAKVVVQTATQAEVATVPASLNKLMALRAEPVSYDPQTQITSVPVRLQNVSNRPLYGPFVVTIKSLGRWEIISHGDNPADMPAFVNSANGLRGKGATFVYSHALGDFTSLDPGAITDAVVWKFRSRPYMTPDVIVEIRGRVKR